MVAGSTIKAPMVVATMVMAFRVPRRIIGIKLEMIMTENPKIRARDV